MVGPSRRQSIHVLMIASEVAPWAKTGGLADVTGALPGALAALGHRVTTVLPRYRNVVVPPGAATRRARVALGAIGHDVEFRVVDVAAGERLVFVEAPALFDRSDLYGSGGRDYADNDERFGLLAAAALDFAAADAATTPIDVVHAHDWQAALAPVLVRQAGRHQALLSQAGLVLTIHNLAYQGVFDRDVVPKLGLPWTSFTIDTGEFWGRYSFLKAGITAADMITTVSPAYARETLRPEFGAGLEGVLSARTGRYVGILNGIDTTTWNPATDRHLPATYDADDLRGKAACKRALLERCGLPVGDDALGRPVVGLVSRLVAQKGFDLVARAAEELVSLDATWIIVGVGDRKYETFFRELAVRYPTRVATHIGFDEGLAHLVEAGSDIFLMPSVFEPCGLNQMYSLRYGAVPVVTAVGGLDDTIQPYTNRAKHANGFKFRDQSPETLVRTLRQAIRLYHDQDAWRPLMVRGMRADHSWRTSAVEYVKVYGRARQIAAGRATG